MTHIRNVGSKELMYSRVTIVLYTWKLLRVDLKYPQHTHTLPGYVNYHDLDNNSTIYIHTYI